MNWNFKIRRGVFSNHLVYLFRKLTFLGFKVSLLMVSVMGSQVAKAEVKIELSPLVAKSQVVSRTDPTKLISIVLVLPLKDPAGAAEFVRQVSTPKDELYGQFLTPQEFAIRFGANENDYQTAKKWATANGLSISEESISRTTLTVHGSVSQFEQLFNTQINDYRSPNGEEFYSASTPPVSPKAVSSILMGVLGLSQAPYHTSTTKSINAPSESASGSTTDVIFNGGTGPRGGLTAADLRDAYAIPPYLGSAKPQTVAVFAASPFLASEVQKYIAYNHLPNVQITPRPVDGSGSGIFYPYEYQTVLDIDVIIGINPALKEVLVYEESPPNIILTKALSAVANDNVAQTLDVSWFLDESYVTSAEVKAEAQELTQLAAQGITVVAAVGDRGPGNSGVSDPATQPLVTTVGGTALTADNQGPFFSSYVYEEVWNTVDYATGGGVSSFWPIPSWQPAATVTPNGGSATNRNVPDVAAVASPGTPVAIYYSYPPGWSLVGGTGVSSAIWAGFISIMNSARQTAGLGKIGFFNPMLYGMQSLYAYAGMNDVVYGYNGYPANPGYFAGPGYDNCTGWGSTYGTYFAAQFLLTPTKNGTPPGAFGGLSGVAAKTTAKLTWAKSQGATGYLIIYQWAGRPDTLFWDFVTNKTNITLTGLKPGIIYLASVTALNRSGVTGCNASIYLAPQ